MPPIVTTAEIDRPPPEVFACATDPSLFSQWQQGVGTGTWTARRRHRYRRWAQVRHDAAHRRREPPGHLRARRTWTRPGPGASGAPTARSGRLSTSWSSRHRFPLPADHQR